MLIHCSVYLFLVVASCSWCNLTCAVTTQLEDPENGNFWNFPLITCPNAEDIHPCVCNNQEHHAVMDLTCKGISDEQELFDIFNSTIPIPHFRTLYLDCSHLTTLTDTVFGDAKFEEVWTNTLGSDGTLTSVGPYTFMKSASTLKHLYLDYNQLSDFPFETLSQYTRLEEFSITGNPISNFPIIKSETIKGLWLDYSAYHTIPAAALDGLPNLEYFYAEDTGIDSMASGLFTSLPHLKAFVMYRGGLTHLKSQQFAVSSTGIDLIELAGNQIATVEADAFAGVQSGRIDLMYNKLTILPEAIWRPVIDAGVRIWLYGNKLTCGCDVAWLVLEPLYHPQVEDAHCQSGEKLVDLDPHIFDSC